MHLYYLAADIVTLKEHKRVTLIRGVWKTVQKRASEAICIEKVHKKWDQTKRERKIAEIIEAWRLEGGKKKRRKSQWNIVMQ